MDTLPPLHFWEYDAISLDGFEPRLAAFVIAAVSSLDEKTITASWACESYIAEQEMMESLN